MKYVNKIAFYIVFYLSLFTMISCNETKLEIKSNSQVVKTPVVKPTNNSGVKDSLEQMAIRLTELYDNKNCKEFFNAFPNNFQEFNQLYGYEDEKGERILYSKYSEHISYFFNCSEKSKREKLTKSIEIGIDGKWEADAIGAFQDSTFDLVKDNINEAKELLDNLPNEKASSFWYFLLDGAHPTDKEKIKRVDLLNKLLDKESNQSKLLTEQFQKLRDSSKD